MNNDPTLFCMIGALLLLIPLTFAKIEPHYGHRPPEHPPGWKNIKKGKKRSK
jgi:hypothetical protein